MALAVFERDFATTKLALEFKGEPPLTGGQVGRRGMMAEFGPVGIVGGIGKAVGIGDGEKTRKLNSLFRKKHFKILLIVL